VKQSTQIVKPENDDTTDSISQLSQKIFI